MPARQSLVDRLISVLSETIATCLFVVLAACPSMSWAQSEPVKTVAIKSDVEVRPNIDERHPLYKLLEVAERARLAINVVDDYECIFEKRELLNRKLVKTTMRMKFREKPFSVYLKFIEPNQGREVLYVQGKNNNNLLVREGGFKSVVGTLSLSPTGPDVMAENRHPITNIGLKHMLETIIKQWEEEGKVGGVTTQMRPNSRSKALGNQVCTVYEAIHTEQFKEFKFHTTRLWIDDETGIAVGVQQLGFPTRRDAEPTMVEEYFYGQLKLDAKLTNADFDKNNPNYSLR